MQDDVYANVGAQNVLADVASCVGIVESFSDALLGQGHLASNIEKAGVETKSKTGHQATLDQLMRVPLHKQAVFVGARLGLITVDDQIAGPYRRHESPLDASGEACATPAE